jgi:hypothetical protein
LLPESLGNLVDFQRWYRDIYDHYAASDHPATLGLERFVHLDRNPVVATVDGEPERELEEDLRPYWIAAFAFADALVVSHLATGRPRLQPLRQALELIGTIRNLERAGRLSVTARNRRELQHRSRRQGDWDGCGLAALVCPRRAFALSAICWQKTA